MIKLTRIISYRTWLFLSFICLLIAWNSAFALFKKPKWLDFSSNEEASLWAEMSRDFAIECDENNPNIQKQIRWYQQHPKYLQHILKSAAPFINYVYAQTHQKNLPAELALIPIIESQYNPAIGAKSGAAGLWQMMPGTATKYGLKINYSYDGRKDVSASTKAALTYLSYLYQYFNKNWLLALAAYDAGEGKIQSVARRHCFNFWQMPLSKETKEYIPRLLAIAYIIKQPEQYNLRLPQIANQSSLQEMVWQEADVINVSETAKNLGIDDSTLRRYNPGLRKNIANVPKRLTLLIPFDRALRNDQKNLISLQQDNSFGHDSADTAYETAVSLPEPEPLQHQKLTYKTKKSVSSKKSNLAPKKYKIRSGDTLLTIAKKFKVSAKQLKTENHLKNEKQLQINHTLLIPAK